MAISIQVSQYPNIGRAPGTRVEVQELPPAYVSRHSAFGALPPFSRSAKYFRIRNSGDAAAFRVHKVVDTADEELQGEETERLEPGDAIDFMLPDNEAAEQWTLSILPYV